MAKTEGRKSRDGRRPCGIRSGVLLGVATIGAVAVTLPAPNAHAASGTDILKVIYNPMTVVNSIDDAYQLFQLGQALFDASGPSTADLINQAVATLETYMDTQRDLVWKANTLQAFNDLDVLARNQPSDPTNTGKFQEIWNDLSSGIDSMYTILPTANDPRSSYETAAVLNEMGSGWIALLVMKGQIWPGYPSAWGDFQTRLHEVMQLDYQMVGARRFMCDPGFDPGWGDYDDPSNAYNGYFPDGRDTFASQFWQNLAKGYTLQEGSPATTYSRCTVTQTPYCNAGSGTCWYLVNSGGCGPNSEVGFSSPSGVSQVRASFAQNTFDVDPVVMIVRDAMNNLLWVGGGQRGLDDGNTSLPTEAGVYIDPWVEESANCSNVGGAAYPMYP